MHTSIKQIQGNWDLGYVLSPHTLSATFLGNDAQGHPQFDTTYSEIGTALRQLKYRNDWSQLEPLATTMAGAIKSHFLDVGLVVPMPASKLRLRQPVYELASQLAGQFGVNSFPSLLKKAPGGAQLKNFDSKAAKAEALKGSITLVDGIQGNGPWNVLLLDDLYDSGATAEAATSVLRTYPKIAKIYFAAFTWCK